MILDGPQGGEFYNLTSSGQRVVCPVPKYREFSPFEEEDISGDSKTWTLSIANLDECLTQFP